MIHLYHDPFENTRTAHVFLSLLPKTQLCLKPTIAQLAIWGQQSMLGAHNPMDEPYFQHMTSNPQRASGLPCHHPGLMCPCSCHTLWSSRIFKTYPDASSFLSLHWVKDATRREGSQITYVRAPVLLSSGSPAPLATQQPHPSHCPLSLTPGIICSFCHQAANSTHLKTKSSQDGRTITTNRWPG